jgi:hypothetical protein
VCGANHSPLVSSGGEIIRMCGFASADAGSSFETWEAPRIDLVHQIGSVMSARPPGVAK